MVLYQVSNAPQDVNLEAFRKKVLFEAHSNTCNSVSKLFALTAAGTILGAGFLHKFNTGKSLLDAIGATAEFWGPFAVLNIPVATFSFIAGKYFDELSKAYDQISQYPTLDARDIVHLKS